MPIASGLRKSVHISDVLHNCGVWKYSDHTASLMAVNCFPHLFAACVSRTNIFSIIIIISRSVNRIIGILIKQRKK